MLNEHDAMRIIVEPFHPRRYRGLFHRAALRSLDHAVALLSPRWNGVKHVVEADGWPFRTEPDLNTRLFTWRGCQVLYLVRRNLLRRAVSHLISRRIDYWIGNRAAFNAKVAATDFPPLNPGLLRRRIDADRDEIATHLGILQREGVSYRCIDYEDFYAPASAPACLERVNALFDFLNLPRIDDDAVGRRIAGYFEPDTNKWANAEVYRHIPRIDEIETQLGCDETGWLFRDP
jgi:hypothetical protein